MDARCRYCKREFYYRQKTQPGKKQPDCCGRIPCRFRRDFTDEDWEGRARMAHAREAAGGITKRGRPDPYGETETLWSDQPLDEIDKEALRRET